MSEPILEDTKTANINNQRVFEEIDEFMIEVFSSLNITWTNKHHREEFVEMIDMWMEQYAFESGKIIQFDILCDSRNNTVKNFKKGPVHFTIRYRQKNCLNTSEIDYMIKAK